MVIYSEEPCALSPRACSVSRAGVDFSPTTAENQPMRFGVVRQKLFGVRAMVAVRRAHVAPAVVACLVLLLTPARADDPPDYQKAEMLVRQGQWDKGIALLQSVIRADPDNPKARNLMGIAMTGKGDLTRANEQFRRALKIDPRFYPALKNLAINELALKDTSAAERDFTAALKLAPNDPIIHIYLGEIAYGRHNYPKAAAHLSVTGRLLLKDPNLTLHLVESYLEIHQAEKATDLLKEFKEQRTRVRSEIAISSRRHPCPPRPIFRGSPIFPGCQQPLSGLLRRRF